MTELRSPRLSDRASVKRMINLSADLRLELADYVRACQRVYGQSDAIVELIPRRLRAFLDADPGGVESRMSGSREAR